MKDNNDGHNSKDVKETLKNFQKIEKRNIKKSKRQNKDK